MQSRGSKTVNFRAGPFILTFPTETKWNAALDRNNLHDGAAGLIKILDDFPLMYIYWPRAK